MRVVGGSARGRRLGVPRGDAVRPTTDRVRGAIANALGSLDVVDDARVLDLFAGSGALGIEMLSRGAAHATFVEPDRSARACLTANLDVTGLADRAEVVASRAEAHLARTAGREASDPLWDIVLLDPPYAFDAWDQLMAALVGRLSPGGVVVIESDRPPTLGPGWDVVRERRYGTTFVMFARGTSATPTEPQ